MMESTVKAERIKEKAKAGVIEQCPNIPHIRKNTTNICGNVVFQNTKSSHSSLFAPLIEQL